MLCAGWGLTFDTVANAMHGFSVDLLTGSVKIDTGEILFRTNSQAYSGDESGSLPLLTRPDGTRIFVRDVARVIHGFEDVAISSRFNDKSAVLVQVFRAEEQRAVQVSRAAHAYAERASASAPNGIEISIWKDRACDLESRVDLLVGNAISGLALVFSRSTRGCRVHQGRAGAIPGPG